MTACVAEPTDREMKERRDKRRRDILLLLGSRNDARYEPEGADAKRMRLAAERGEVASKRVPCPNGCEGGWLADRFQRRTPCPRCGGHELVTEEMRDGLLVTVGVPQPGRGWIEVDDYTGRETGSERTGVTIARTRTVPCDRCAGTGVHRFTRCELCLGSGRREVAAEPLRAAHAAGPRRADEVYNDPCLVAEQRWRELGSYAALDVALSQLAVISPLMRRLVYTVYESGERREADLAPPLRKRLEAALRFLERELPRRLRVPRAVREAAEYRDTRLAHRWPSIEARDRDLRRLRFVEGWSVPALMGLARLSRSQLYDVLGRTE